MKQLKPAYVLAVIDRDDAADVVVAAAKASAWLDDAREASGWWRDYRLGRQVSDEYVTAYVCAALSTLAGSVDAETLRTAEKLALDGWKLLADRVHFRRDAGWGWNLALPSDADSTAFALMTARNTGNASTPEALAAREFLDEHVSDLGVRTYSDLEKVRRIAAHSEQESAWIREQACVTAAVAGRHGSLTPGLGDALVRKQQSDGHWRGYWWVTPDYPSGIVCLALDPSRDQVALQRAAQWLKTCEAPVGTFDTAWRLVACVCAGEVVDLSDLKSSLMSQLLETQRQDGSWSTSAKMWLPDPGDEAPHLRERWSADHRGIGAVTTDQNGIVSTVTALFALALASGGVRR